MMKFTLVFILFLSSIILSEEFQVNTSSGVSHGIKQNKVIFWEDIPYAQPPVGDLRWKAPLKLNSLSMNHSVTPKDNNFCVQEPSGLGGSEGDNFFSGTEDCLYLDIRAPTRKQNKLLPVMFWIHGGGNTTGLKDIYDFSPLVTKHNVIVVSINYRLGPFGWFTHPSIQDLQSDIDKTSNFGTLDIIQALKWVRDNIALFGGDPRNVTIFGESAGGHNVLSLIASNQAKGLFHKAITQSGYTTSYSMQEAHKPSINTSIFKYSSWNIVDTIIKEKSLNISQTQDKKIIRNLLKSLSAEDFFKHYTKRPPYEYLPLLTADGIVIPKIGLASALSKKDYVNKVPTIAGSNRDEVKLWLASAKYFIELDYSFLGSIFDVPKVKIKNKEAFNLFNSYRSRAWKIRGVDDPLKSLSKAGNNELYAYRYDWDDHRRFIIADFRELIGAAHATEIPLLAGNNKLVGSYGFLIYPNGPSKRFASKNMMQFWTNFAKTGKPGFSSNGIEWKKYNQYNKNQSDYMVLDRKSNLGMQSDSFSFSTLTKDLFKEEALTKIEKCVVLFQMLTYVGDDLYDDFINEYPGRCSRKESEQFLMTNSEFIDY